MKSFKAIISLITLIVAGNTCAVTTQEGTKKQPRKAAVAPRQAPMVRVNESSLQYATDFDDFMRRSRIPLNADYFLKRGKLSQAWFNLAAKHLKQDAINKLNNAATELFMTIQSASQLMSDDVDAINQASEMAINATM